MTSKTFWLLAGFVLVIGLFLAAGCEQDTKAPEQEPKWMDGKRLAQAHCASCHLVPDPGTLDKKTWRNHILVRMGAFMGIYTDNVRYYDSLLPQWLEPGLGGKRVMDAGIYPSEPKISRDQFESIVAYYLKEAPETSRGVPNPGYIHPEMKHFTPKPFFTKTEFQPLVFGVKLDPVRERLIASFYKQDVLLLEPDGTRIDALGKNEAVVDISLEQERITLTDLGSMIGADTPKGKVLSGGSFSDLKSGKKIFSMDSLQRPVQATWSDLNEDGLEDLLVCEYGNYLGHLAWYQARPDGTYEKQILNSEDGSIRAYVEDIDGDGRKDILALMANGDEGIDAYLNQGNGKFQPKRLLRFPPTYGSTWIDLVDFDQDGDKDILYSNGDNGDYHPILKPYHGVRLYENQGNLEFKEAFYLPVNGVYRAEAHDFDLDGDLDIAVVSFYPDFQSRPEEAFIYFENNGGNQFSGSTFPGVDHGRWMVFDVGDIDSDGDLDILLGAFNQKSSETPPAVIQTWEEYDTPLVLLENTVK